MPEDDDSQKLDMLRHSAAHLMAAAIASLYPSARFGVGPTTENGFFYDFMVDPPLGVDDLPAIEERMQQLAKSSVPFERIEVKIDEAIDLMRERDQPYKVELLGLLKEKGTTAVVKETGDSGVVASGAAGIDHVSLYRLGNFVDLCRGPHLPSVGAIRHFKLTSIAGAYWRGDSRNPQLQRIYAIAFDNTAALKTCIWELEEAKKRDHRKLGQQLELFRFAEDVGPGLPLWMPSGTVLRDELELLARIEERREGYQRVKTPILTKQALYYRSGHLPYYKDDMYAPMDIDGETYYIRPMNCPHHHQIYLARPRSYRELPFRIAEYADAFRYEASGALTGLMRVRGFCQNDAHIYCAYDQAKDEFKRVMELHAYYYRLFDIDRFYMRLSLPDLEKLDKYVDAPEKWLAALEVIRAAMKESGLPYVEKEGEAAFYGPKVDFMVRSAIGTEWAISTNQLDFLASERFGLTYIAEDGREAPVYVIHRAPLGSHERFVAFLIEHYGGNFPTWLAPIQLRVIPISDKHIDYAIAVRNKLLVADIPTGTQGLRADADLSSERMQKKIRNGQMLKIPYMLVVGDAEMAKDSVSVRLRDGTDLGSMSIDALLDRLKPEIATRADIFKQARGPDIKP